MVDQEQRVKALEEAVWQLTQVVLSMGGSERAWQMAMLGLIGTTAAATNVGNAISVRLEEARQAMEGAGLAQAHIDGFCGAGRVIIEAIRTKSVACDSATSLH